MCQFGLDWPSAMTDWQCHALRPLSRRLRSLAQERAQKTMDRDGVRIGGNISDVFGVNGRIMLQGLVAADSHEDVLARMPGPCQRQACAARQ